MNQNQLATTEESRPLWQLLNTQSTMRKFELACGREAGSVMINVINAANINPEIWECEPNTVITSALNAAAMNLSLVPSLGQGVILPYRKFNKTTKTWEKHAEFVPEVRGYKAMAMRTGKYIILNNFKVYEGQEWVEDQMTGLGHIEGKPVSEKVIGYGAFLRLTNGYEATHYMTAEETMAWAVKYSPTYNKNERRFYDNSRWLSDFDGQSSKTVIKWLIKHKGVISDRDRKMLDQLDEEAEWDQETFNAGEDKPVDGEAKVIDPETAIAEMGLADKPAYPKELEIPWNMTGKDGAKFGELSDDVITERIKAIEGLGSKLSEDSSAKLSALRQIRDYRKSLN